MHRIVLLGMIVLAVLGGCGQDSGNKKCNTAGELYDFTFERQDDNVLRYDISYKISDSVNSYIKFWEKDNPHNVNFINAGRGTEIKTTLYGIKANTEYSLQIVFGKQCEWGSDVVEFKSDRLPYKELYGFELVKDKKEFNGHILFHQAAS